MEDLLVDKYQWIVMDPGTTPTRTSDRRLENFWKELWDKLGTLY
jgi:hypothetical protein